MSGSHVSALSVSDLNHIIVCLVSKQSGGTVSTKSPDGITPTSEPVVLNAPSSTGDTPKSKTAPTGDLHKNNISSTLVVSPPSEADVSKAPVSNEKARDNASVPPLLRRELSKELPVIPESRKQDEPCLVENSMPSKGVTVGTRNITSHKLKELVAY